MSGYWWLCVVFYFLFFFFKQKTAYEMRISDWSSDVCSSDLFAGGAAQAVFHAVEGLGHRLQLGQAVALGEAALDAPFGNTTRGGGEAPQATPQVEGNRQHEIGRAHV